MVDERDARESPPPAGTELCRFEDLPDGQGKEFVFGGPYGFRMFVARRDESVFGYVNRCPHWSLTLNLDPDRFVSLDGEFLFCSNHGARFRFEDGYCLEGPCAGDRLTGVPLSVADGIVRIGRIGRVGEAGEE